MSEKYQPNSGTEGDAFMSQFCYQCARHHTEAEEDADSGDVCEIVLRTQAWSVNDPEYPAEWQSGEDGACCTAFVPKGEPIPLPRCKRTVDMFNTCACLITNLDGHCVECGRVPS